MLPPPMSHRRLTPAGHLRPNDVSQLAAELPVMRDWMGLANRETQTFPVMDFREAMQGIGLARKNRGRLVLTKAGAAARDDPERVRQHLLGRLPTGSDKSMDRPSGWMYLVSTARGDVDPYDTIADAMTALGQRQNFREPVGYRAVRDAVAHCTSVVRNLMASSSGLSVWGRSIRRSGICAIRSFEAGRWSPPGQSLNRVGAQC